MILNTTKCGQFKHPEFTLEADESAVPATHLQDMAKTIESMVAQGSVFKPGETSQVGWMITEVQRYGTSQLTLVEPDMKSFPIKWVPGITHTLRQKMIQVFMLDSVSLRDDMEIPSILQSLLVCTRYTSSSFFMNRSENPNETDSGWFVGCLEDGHNHNDPANLRCVSLYEAYLHQHGIEGFVTFPVGSMIVCEPGEGVTIFKDGQKCSIQKGSMLEAWFRQRSQ